MSHNRKKEFDYFHCPWTRDLYQDPQAYQSILDTDYVTSVHGQLVIELISVIPGVGLSSPASLVIRSPTDLSTPVSPHPPNPS